MQIIEKLLTVNPMSRPQKSLSTVEKIVIHYVGNPNTTALANRNYFENLKNQKIRYASSHYIIGLDGEIIRCIPDNEIAYHAGNYQMNLHSIGIENCHTDSLGKFNSKTYESLVELTASLCDKFKLNPQKDVIRHYDVTKKMCPIYYVKHDDEWREFLNDVSKACGSTFDNENYNFLVGDVVNVLQELDGFYSSNALNPVSNVSVGTYKIYKIALGALHEINITKDKDPGYWVDKEFISK